MSTGYKISEPGGQKFIEQKIDYIHNNPVLAGILNKPEDYIYSSAELC